MTERTPQDVLRELQADEIDNLPADCDYLMELIVRRASNDEYHAAKGRLIRIRRFIDKAIAEAPDSPECQASIAQRGLFTGEPVAAPDSPPLTLRDFAPPRYRHEPDGMRFDPKGAYVLFHMTAAAVKEAAPDSRKPSAIAGVTGEAARILDAVVEAAPDTLSEKPVLDVLTENELERALTALGEDNPDVFAHAIFKYARLGSTDSESED